MALQLGRKLRSLLFNDGRYGIALEYLSCDEIRTVHQLHKWRALKLSERLRITGLKMQRSRRAAVSRLLASRPFRWRLAPATVSNLLIVPQDLRTADPSFAHEIELGQFGLAGTVVHLDDKSPFEIEPPNEGWERALHSFGWLRHLEAAGSDEARDTATRLAVEWTIRYRSGTGIAWEPHVIARRIISWISHASFLLDGTDARLYDAMTRSLAAQIVRLSATWRDAPTGEMRLQGLIALLLTQLCVAGQERRIPATERAFLNELSKEILPDGGHVSRNTAVLIDLVLDLLPLKQCFASRERPLPPALEETLQKMISMLRFMRLGDGRLSRFNGVSTPALAGLATILGYDDAPDNTFQKAPESRYVRLEKEGVVVVSDVGSAPPLPAASKATAGCLSFEMSSGRDAVFVNCGTPAAPDASWIPVARATASHNTVCLGEEASAQLNRHKVLEDLLGAPPLVGPELVESTVEDHSGTLEMHALHNGYVKRFGLVHRRSLVLQASGRRLLGVDRIEGHKVKVRLRQDVTFAIHFHLHPDVSCQQGTEAEGIALTLKNGDKWQFSAEGGQVSIEDSTFFADSSGPRSSLQIVVRGATFGETEVRWIVERSN